MHFEVAQKFIWEHVGVIPTCPENKYQLVEARTTNIHMQHWSAAKSGNILLSFHNERWRAGIHPVYG